MSDDKPLTFGGIPLICDDANPPDVAYLVPRPPMLPGETFTAYRARCIRLGVRLVNIATAPR